MFLQDKQNGKVTSDRRNRGISNRGTPCLGEIDYREQAQPREDKKQRRVSCISR